MTFTIKIHDSDRTIPAHSGELLADKILEGGIDLSLYCQKKAVCGKCFVQILQGYLPPFHEGEEFLLKKNKLSPDHRLACRYKIRGNLVVHIPQKSLLQKTVILKTGIKTPLAVDPLVKKYAIKFIKPELDHPHSLLSGLRKHFRKKDLEVPVDILKTLPEKLKKSGFHITTAVYDDRKILAIEPGDTTERSFGLAVDLGTTTLVVELVALNNGKSIDTATENNRQMKYGMDIVSRISFAFQNPDNLKKLQAAVSKSLALMIEQLLEKNKVPRDHIYEMVFAGNTAMNHMLLSMPVDSLAVSPFHAVFHRLPGISPDELGLGLYSHAKVYIVPNIKSFVGGDISAGIHATGLASRKGNYLFIDLGTNGEIVLKTERRFVATSTAAGPAFEGMNIASGMLALPGAIYKVEKANQLVLHTIGKEKPLGICGTGLIDLVALFLNEGKIEASGKIAGNKDTLKITDKISLSQQDIREIQLAVAAVKTGVRLLCEKFHIRYENLNRIFVAGAFGNYLNTQNAMRIGLLPDIDPKKIVFVGNSSLAGARAILLSKSAREKTESTVKKVHYISLASDPRFQDYFVDSLNFGIGKNAE